MRLLKDRQHDEFGLENHFATCDGASLGRHRVRSACRAFLTRDSMLKLWDGVYD